MCHITVPKVEIRRRPAIIMKIDNSIVIDVSLREPHQRIGDVVSKDQLAEGRRLHNVVNNLIGRRVRVLGVQIRAGDGLKKVAFR